MYVGMCTHICTHKHEPHHYNPVCKVLCEQPWSSLVWPPKTILLMRSVFALRSSPIKRIPSVKVDRVPQKWSLKVWLHRFFLTRNTKHRKLSEQNNFCKNIHCVYRTAVNLTGQGFHSTLQKSAHQHHLFS